jgi:hypothetical protein
MSDARNEGRPGPRLVSALELLAGSAIVLGHNVFRALPNEVPILVARAADLGKGSTAAYVFGVVFVAVLFGYGHFYKGPAGVVDSTFAGLVLGGAFLVSGRNLWACVLAHGFIDTFGIVALYFGWAT